MTIDGGNGTLVPGMFEMHAHLDQEDALLNLLSGITSVRDMGNTNDVLDGLIARIDAGTIAGPRVTRSGFIEGKSPFNANNGIVVDSEAAALDAVRWYGARGYWQIKIYNSINPAWVPAMVQEAHRLGMRVAGHVPAFATADAVIAAGYDELTHINQFMLGWVLQPGEDTQDAAAAHGDEALPDGGSRQPRRPAHHRRDGATQARHRSNAGDPRGADPQSQRRHAARCGRLSRSHAGGLPAVGQGRKDRHVGGRRRRGLPPRLRRASSPPSRSCATAA